MELIDIVKNEFKDSTIHQVWYCKTLQHKKGLFYVVEPKVFIEATMNGDKGETYIDIYKKERQVVVKEDI